MSLISVNSFFEWALTIVVLLIRLRLTLKHNWYNLARRV